MKKLIFVLAFFALSCNNEEKSSETNVPKAQTPVIDSSYVGDTVDVRKPIK
jgi:hypothetical protein